MLRIALPVLALSACVTDPAPLESEQAQEVAGLTPVLREVTVGPTRIELAWTPVIGATKYVLLRGPAPGQETSYTTLGALAVSYSNGHMAPGETSCWQLRAMTVLGATTSNEVCLTTPAVLAPTNPSAAALASDRIRVDWDASSGALGYYIYQSRMGGPYIFAASAPAGLEPNIVIAGLHAHTGYSYRIATKISSTLASELSDPVAATTQD